METKKARHIALKHILCCLILLLAFVITFTRVDAKNQSNGVSVSETDDTVPLRPLVGKNILKLKTITKKEIKKIKYDKPRIIEKNIYYYLSTEKETLNFFANAFGYDIEFVKEDLINRSDNKDFEPTNIGSLKNESGDIIKYNNVQYGIVEYFYDLTKNHSQERTRKIIPYNGNSDYVEKLIMYYTTIYNDVDTSLALSIGAAESGYYEVKYMLNMNNIYGGMGNNGLIRYDNIEIGVLSYIRLLSNNYFKKGLTTPESIGRIYCPTINEYGNKVASPHWINLVNTAKNKYNNYTQNITIKDIVS